MADLDEIHKAKQDAESRLYNAINNEISNLYKTYGLRVEFEIERAPVSGLHARGRKMYSMYYPKIKIYIEGIESYKVKENE